MSKKTPADEIDLDLAKNSVALRRLIEEVRQERQKPVDDASPC